MNLKRKKEKRGWNEGRMEGRKEGGEGGENGEEEEGRKERFPGVSICSLDGMYLIVFSKISPRYEG